MDEFNEYYGLEHHLPKPTKNSTFAYTNLGLQSMPNPSTCQSTMNMAFYANF